MLYAHDETARHAWAHEAEGILSERCGEVLWTQVRALVLPPRTRAETHEALRQWIGYCETNRHRSDYLAYR